MQELLPTTAVHEFQNNSTIFGFIDSESNSNPCCQNIKKSCSLARGQQTRVGSKPQLARMTSLPENRKRKRRDGASMARFRETVDPDTGEVYHVETTRQAKRRHQRNGAAQFRPTVAQINAADIWNKQEEKIKRDKEREERRKKNKLKQEAKDARQREIQQEMLKRGKISIEDTWGKVNASQNRLHKFFAPPKAQSEPTTNPVEQESDTSDSTSPESDTEEESSADEEEHNMVHKTQAQVHDLKSAAQALPPLHAALPSPVEPPSHHNTDHPSGNEDNATLGRTRTGLKRCFSASQAMMPPPALPVVAPPALREYQDMIGSMTQNPGINEPRAKLSSVQRSPLSEMTMSAINVRANEKPDPLEAEMQIEHIADCFPVATQVVRDTLSGLCSQDFDDDFANEPAQNEKENLSPLSSFKSAKLGSDKETTSFQQESDLRGNEDSDDADVNCEQNLDQVYETEDFDDEGINDEFLLSLAATQQLKKEFLRSSKQKVCSPPRLEEQTPKTTSVPMCARSPRQSRSMLSRPPGPTLPSQTGDSFAMDGLDDSDLLECLEDYENDTEGLDDEDLIRCVENLEQTKNTRDCDTQNEAVELPLKKKRRILPWDRNPIADLPNTGGNISGSSDELTLSPASPPCDE